MKKFLASVAVALCALVGSSASALAQNYPPNVLVIVIVSGPVTPGSTVTITITGCQAGETVTVAVDGVTITVSTCTGGGGTSALRRQAAGGSATASFTAPTTVGTHTIRAVGNTSGRVGTLTFTVQPAAAAATTRSGGGGGALPTTGSDSTPTLWIAGTALVVGAGLAGVAWKRRRPTAA